MSDIFLLPGRMAILAGNGVIRTVLGSCVSVVIYDPIRILAGVNHFLLPEPLTASDAQNRLKYGVFAIPDLLQAMLERGASPSQLCAEVYGGAAVVDHLLGNFTIGDRNIEITESLLSRLKIKVLYRDVGGRCGRKISVHLPDCHTEIKIIPSQLTGS
jgi:chemotaxis receptor (MCP) glutamine deamidase CheD